MGNVAKKTYYLSVHSADVSHYSFRRQIPLTYIEKRTDHSMESTVI